MRETVSYIQHPQLTTLPTTPHVLLTYVIHTNTTNHLEDTERAFLMRETVSCRARVEVITASQVEMNLLQYILLQYNTPVMHVAIYISQMKKTEWKCTKAGTASSAHNYLRQMYVFHV